MRRSICLILACIFILFLSGTLSKAESKTLTGTLYYRDAPMSTLTEASPQFWFLNRDTFEYLYPDRDLTVNYDPTNSTYEILDCPESTKFLIDVSFPGEYGSDTDLPKSYDRQITIDTTTLDSQDIQLYYNIHLLTPFDNSNVNTYYPAPPYPAHNSPVQFSWEAVTGADSYEIEIQRTRDPDNPEGGYGDIETIINENTTSLTYTADIPSSASFEHYEFSLSAYENGTYLGRYTTVYYGANGWDYRFKINKEKSKFMPWLMLLLDDEIDLGLPNAPSGLTVNNPNPSSTTLNWEDASNNENGFTVFMAPSQFGTYSYIESISANTTTYIVSGLTPSTTYWFKVTAYNTNGESDFSNIVSVTTPPASPAVGVFGTSQWDSGNVFGQ